MIAQGIAGLFEERGVSLVAGRSVLLPRRLLSEESVEEATTAGALAVIVDGRLPAGAFTLDVPAGVPVVGLPERIVRELRALIAAGVPVTVSVGAVDVEQNVAGDSVAAFSSRGLAFQGGLKPDLVAAGVAVPTSEPGRGRRARCASAPRVGRASPRPLRPGPRPCWPKDGRAPTPTSSAGSSSARPNGRTRMSQLAARGCSTFAPQCSRRSSRHRRRSPSASPDATPSSSSGRCAFETSRRDR